VDIVKGGDMDSTVETIEVVCPRCGDEFALWYRLSPDPADPATCPTCGHDLAEDRLLHEEGFWVLVADDGEAERV
jgi:predicted RNA-binding Zn-ribbon protein involved in translation (DUF1610 family)